MTINTADLAQYIGTEHWYRHALVREILYTDGAKYVAEEAGAYWLLDEIALAQRAHRRVVAEEFQTWELVVHADKRATLTCGDGNGGVVFRKKIGFTDFPLGEFRLYCVDKTIMLPTEY